MTDAEPILPAPAPPTSPAPDLACAWLAQSHDLLALTDSAGWVAWANGAFQRAIGHAVGDAAAPLVLTSLLPSDAAGLGSRDTMMQALQLGVLHGAELQLRTAAGTPLWVHVCVCSVGAQRLWTLQDLTQTRLAQAEAQRQAEWLEAAQEFGRLGVWERHIPSGAGHWDRHVFGFWGLAPEAGTPDYEAASSRVHPEDHNTGIYRESIRQAGRYSQHYRVVQPDGSLRRIHSQWQVKNSPEGQPDRAVGVMMDDTDIYELARSRDAAGIQLKLAVELGNICVWRHDFATGLVHYPHPAYAAEDFQIRPEGLPIEEVRGYIHPDDLAGVIDSAQRALRTDRPVDHQARYRRPDGGWRHVLTRRIVQRNAGGKALGFIGVALDLSHQAEQSRRADDLLRRLEAAALAARIGIWSMTLDSSEADWNAQMFELFDIAGTRTPSLKELVAERVHADDRERVVRVARDFLRHGATLTELEFRCVRRDGSVRWIVMRADVDRSSTERRRIFGVAMDTTEQHAPLAALREAGERSALITRSAGIGIWEADVPGSAVRWDEQMFRLRKQEPRGQAPSREERLSIVHPDDLPLVLDAHPEMIPGDAAQAYEFRVRWPDGSYRWLASRSAPVRDTHGQVVRRVGVNWDITESKNAELARRQILVAERESAAKSQFLSRMSHELRTPLNAVLGFTQLLQIEASGASGGADAKRAAQLGHIRSAGEHLLALIEDVLDLSSLESGALKLALQPVALAGLGERALPLVEALAAEHGVMLRAGGLEGVARADPTRLLQVLVNLLSNAIKYNHPGGTVEIESELLGDRVALRVRDTGRGLSADQLAHLFEPFNRLGSERDGIAGTGIGLTIVKALVQGMGGSVAVSSRPSEGTVFTVTLPAHAAGAADAAPPAPSAPLARPGRTGRLLYIEDNAVNVLLVEEIIHTLPGLTVVSEPTGAAGVARARALRPELILVDMQLPDCDGFEVLRQLRSHPETAAVRCIALSANAMPEDIARGIQAGFADYWTKPIDFKRFVGALEALFPPDLAA